MPVKTLAKAASSIAVTAAINALARLRYGRPRRVPAHPIRSPLQKANTSALETLRERAVGKAPELAMPYGEPSHAFTGTSEEFYRELVAELEADKTIRYLEPGTPVRRDSMAVQVGGDHYRTTKMQPFEFTLANGWDGAAHTILKYIARCEDKGGAVDLDKALHVVAIRADHMPRDVSLALPRPWANLIPIGVYCEINGYDGHKRLALIALASWMHLPESEWARVEVERAIQAYRATAYPLHNA